MVSRINKYRIIRKKSNLKDGREIFRRLFFFIFGIAMSASMCLAVNNAQFGLENYLYAQINEPIEGIKLAKAVKKEEPDLDLQVKAAYSLRIGVNGNEKDIYKKNEGEIYPIASLTKLMTATVIFENPEYYDLDKKITISQDAASQYDVPVFGNLIAGQVYSVRELLQFMLFYSSNDAAYALAESIGIEKFTEKMNSTAKDLHLTATKFYNPHGLDLDNGLTNQSDAADLMDLVKYIYQNHPEILNYSIKSGQYLTENGIFNLNLWDGNSLIGGKTGFTEKAGGCMIVMFKDQADRKYINIILGASTSEDRVGQMQKLINYANNSGRPVK